MTNYCRNKQVKHPKNIQKTLKSFGCNFFPVGYYFYLKLNWFSGKMCALRSIFLKSLCWHKNHKFLVIKANVKNHYCRKWKKRYVVKFFGFIHKKFWDTIFWYFQCIGVESIHLNGEREYRRGEGGGYRAKSSPLPLASLCVSSPTHTLPNTGYLKIPFPKCIETSSQIAMAIRVEWKKPLKFSMVKKLPNFEPN